MKNFRDLGGNKTEDGRTVKKGLFYRSAKLSNLSENDIKILKELNIKYIFDIEVMKKLVNIHQQ